jgi:hypothetical protein
MRIAVGPFAECARAVAGEVITAQRNPDAALGRIAVKPALENILHLPTQNLLAVGEIRRGWVIQIVPQIAAPREDWIHLGRIGRGNAQLPCAGVNGSGRRGRRREAGLYKGQVREDSAARGHGGDRAGQAERQSELGGEAARSGVEQGLQRLQRRDGDERGGGGSDLGERAVARRVEEFVCGRRRRRIDGGSVVHRLPCDRRQREERQQRSRSAHRNTVDRIPPLAAGSDLDAEQVGARRDVEQQKGRRRARLGGR